jgi:transposase-like protein
MSCKRETVHICIVHLLRHSFDFVSYKDRKAVATALKDIYRALDAAAGDAALAAHRGIQRESVSTDQSALRRIGQRPQFVSSRPAR